MKTREANPYFGVKLLRVECPTRDLPPAGSSWEITSSLSSSWLWLSPTCLLMGGTPGNSGSTADHLVKLRWTFTVHKALCMALFRTSWFVHCFLLPGRVVSTPNIWIPLFLLYMVQFIKWSYLSCLERIRASPLTEVFVNVAFPGRSSLMPSLVSPSLPYFALLPGACHLLWSRATPMCFCIHCHFPPAKVSAPWDLISSVHCCMLCTWYTAGAQYLLPEYTIGKTAETLFLCYA